jgi:hypothetical protein
MVAVSAVHGSTLNNPVNATLQTPHAIIYFPQDLQPLARTTAEAFEFSYKGVGEYLGMPTRKIRIFIYASPANMIRGLMEIAGYDRLEAETIARVGISPRRSNTLHVHKRAKKWGKFYWHAIAHEHAHGVTEERYGRDVALSARWLYEGLGDFIAHRTLRNKYPGMELAWDKKRHKTAFKALVTGKLPHFQDISTTSRWLENIRNGTVSWNTQYAKAYTAVAYLVEQYGFERVLAILDSVRMGEPHETAISKVLGISLSSFETEYNLHLLRIGIFDIYPLPAIGMLLLALFFSALFFFLIKRIRAGSKPD